MPTYVITTTDEQDKALLHEMALERLALLMPSRDDHPERTPQEFLQMRVEAQVLNQMVQRHRDARRDALMAKVLALPHEAQVETLNEIEALVETKVPKEGKG